ncbi:MAG: hypothetical protein U1E27_10440, partial [Kiritimatiellia bacterium]|nr:hypothetical protein [Kiritimatiellia bacterium]
TYEYIGTFHFGITMLPGGVVDPHILWKLDHAVRTMERCGLKWLCFNDDLRRHLDADGVEGHPYWHANGGAARCLEDFYSHPAVLKLQERRLTHMISRFADSPALWIWNCGDESECQPGMKRSKAMVRQWLKHLHRFIRNHDVYEHAHAIGECKEAVSLGSDVVVLEDWYYDWAWPSQSRDHVWLYEHRKDDVLANEGILARYQDLACPVINSEGGHGLVGFIADPPHGHNATLSNPAIDRYSDVSFHIHLWISLFKQCAAGGTNWLCNAMDRHHQLFHAGSIGRYIAGEPLTEGPWKSGTPRTLDERLYGFTLLSPSEERILLWLTDRAYSMHNMILSGGVIEPVTGATLSLMLSGGTWEIEWWNTFEGKRIGVESLSANPGKTRGAFEVQIALPSFTKDIAAKLTRKNSPPPAPDKSGIR